MSGTDSATATAAATATDTAATTPTTAATTATTDTATSAAAGTQTQGAPTVEQLQADVEKWRAMSRKNEAALKTKTDADKAQAALLADVAAKLGIQTTGGTPDPAAITAQLEAAQRDAKTRSTELAVLRAASRLKVDGDALLDSRAFVAQLEGLETTEAIEAAIKLAVAQTPGKYATTQAQTAGTGADDAGTATTTANASSAGDFTGAAGGNRQWTQDDVNRATPEQVTKALQLGLLKSLLGG
jgi:hypothetical protein